jgi:hypothetical protein
MSRKDLNADGFFTFDESHRTADTATVHKPYGYEFDTLAQRDEHQYTADDNGIMVRVGNVFYIITGINGTSAVFRGFNTSINSKIKTANPVTNGFNHTVIYQPDVNGKIDKVPSFVFTREGSLVTS